MEHGANGKVHGAWSMPHLLNNYTRFYFNSILTFRAKKIHIFGKTFLIWYSLG